MGKYLGLTLIIGGGSVILAIHLLHDNSLLRSVPGMMIVVGGCLMLVGRILRP